MIDRDQKVISTIGGGSTRQIPGTVCAPLPEHEKLTPAERAVIKARQGVELITSGELRVVNSDGTEVPADGQTVGEIVVRGNVVMDGYYNDPEATQRATGDGWFHTGDAAVIHPDGRGRRSAAGPLQDPARGQPGHRATQDGDRQDPEVRPPQGRPPTSPTSSRVHDREDFLPIYGV